MNSNTTDCIQAIVSVINLFFVGGVFFYEKYQNRSDKVKEKKEYWYRETLLHRGLDVCENAFDEIERILKEASSICENHTADQDENEIKTCISEIQNQIYKIKHVLGTYLSITDKQLHKKIKEEMEKLQDNLIEALAEAYELKLDCLDRISYLYNMKYVIFYELYKYDINS